MDDLLSSLLDEVALEGLDGITLPMLWARLESRPNFSLAIDDYSKIFIWECIAVQSDIEIFELPKPRHFLPIYNRYEHIDSELGIVLESAEKIVDLYPIEFIKDEYIRGSCAMYKSRVCITSEIRYDDVLLMPLGQVCEKWGEKLVLVASPKARLLSLIGTETNPLLELSQEEYCLLERIGRSRYHGEVTQGEGGLLSLKAPFCKQLHYYRKKLTVKGLVTKQLHYLKSKKGQAVTGSLFHLTRFFIQRKTKMELLMKCMCDILKEKPGNREVCKTLRDELNIKEGTFKKLFYKPFQKWVRIVNITYKEYNPQASVKEMYTSHGQDRIMKVVKLLKHCDDGDNEDEETNEEKEHALPLNVHFDCSKLYHDLPTISQVYRLIQEAGPDGLTSADVGRIITLPKLDVRTLLKVLVKRDVIVTILQEKGRQKETRYIAKSFGAENEAYSNVKKGKEQFSKKSKVSGKRKRNNDNSSEESIATSSKHKRVWFDDEVEKTVLKESREQYSAADAKTVLQELGEQYSEDENFNQIDFQKISCEMSEIQSYDLFTGKSPRLIGVTEKTGETAPVSKGTQMTYRKLKRFNMVMDHLKEIGYSTLTDLQKYLFDKEREEGYTFKIDKKSTARMVHYLYSAKKVKIFKAVLKLDNQKTEMEFICDNSLTSNDPCFQVAIDQAKFKFFSISKDRSKKHDKDVESTEFSNDKDMGGDKKSDDIPKENKLNSLIYQKTLQDMQVNPKFLRSKALHKFLFYLVYQYEGHTGDKSKDPIVYHDSMSWKRFVPPLPSNRKQGWCFLADIFNRMPLSIFVKVMNLRQKIKEFGEYLVDETKSNYLIAYLPKDMLKSLLIKRKYLFSIDEVIKHLCFMGLVKFGPRVSMLKDQVYLYVHKTIAVKDTTISTPGYIHVNPDLAYEKKIFSLTAMDDVDKFWIELEHIASSTPLGKYSAAAGKTIAITPASHKPELLEMLKYRNFDDISDLGHIPGDGLGAGGFDSSLFFHSRRNWHPSNLKVWNASDKNVSNVNPVISIQNLLKSNAKLGPEKPSRLQRLGRFHLAAQKEKILKENVKKNKLAKSTDKRELGSSPPPILSKKGKGVKFRVVKMRSKKTRTPYYDEKDKAAMEKMAQSRTRCEWSAKEDSFLLLCKVASSFLDPASRTIVVPYTVVRDLLHEQFPDIATNKSSRACQRRVRYMMLNPTTTNNVSVFLGEAKQDVSLVKEFDKARPLKTNESTWKGLFTGVLKKLLVKFTLPAGDRCKHITLPETMQIFKRSFEVMSPRNEFLNKSNHKDPDNEQELKYCTLYSLIVSAMAIVHDGTEWSYLLYKLYHGYPEHVLRSVVSRLRSEKVIACKKSKCKRDFIPCNMTTFPYRFSITYDNALLTKFPIKLFGEAKELLDKFKYAGSEESINLRDNVAPGYLTAILSLVLLNDVTLTVKVPEQVILFDTSLSKEARTNIVERMMHSLSDKESYELSRILNEKDFPLNIPVDNQNQNESPPTNELEKKSEDIPQPSEIQHKTNASRFALYLLRQELSQPPIERVQHSQDYIVLNSCQVVCHPESQVNSEVSSDNTSSKQDVSHVQKNVNDQRAKILTDGCISEIKASLTAFIPPEAFTQYQNFDEPLEMIYDAYSPQTLSDAKCIFENIFKANSIGISEKKLWEKFRFLNGELSLFEHLHLFREALLVIRAGVASFVYVCICFAKNWILRSYVMPEFCFKKRFKGNEGESSDSTTNVEDSKVDKSGKNSELLQVENADLLNIDDNNPAFPDNFMDDFTDETSHTKSLDNPSINFTEEVYFLPRSWRHPDGTINKKVFVELLQTVLSFIIHSPGVNMSRVIERFSLVLQPVQTLELLEILEKACCIVKYYCKRPKKMSLFSSPSTYFITKNPEPEDLDHVEPLPDAICNLARIQEAIM